MKRRLLISMYVIWILASLGSVQAQSDIPNTSLMDRFLGSSLETILYRKPIGDLYLSITGERFDDRGYFLLDIVTPEPINVQDLDFTFVFTPMTEEGENKDEAVTRQAQFEEGRFVISPIPTEGADTWKIDIALTDAKGTHHAEFVSIIWPRSPVLPSWLAILSLLFPATIATAILLTFNRVHIPLRQVDSPHP